MLATLLLFLFSTFSIAAETPLKVLVGRQTGTCAEINEVDCGAVCIPIGWTCCPDGSGGCSAQEQCWLGDNGQYGCCPLGETCAGPGGSQTNTVPVNPSTSTAASAPTTSAYPNQCGDDCLDAGYTCCPGGAIACYPGFYCVGPDEYGYNCCMDGKQCDIHGSVLTSSTSGTATTTTSLTINPAASISAEASSAAASASGAAASTTGSSISAPTAVAADATGLRQNHWIMKGLSTVLGFMAFAL